MFTGCISLEYAPDLPATTLAEHCYEYMFYDCEKLYYAPKLPATTLADYCYYYMFAYCYNFTSYSSVPNLEATNLARSCYEGMFTSCINLPATPELPATTMKPYCYSEMFKYCTNITNIPSLPATTLADGCYERMFCGCSSLELKKEESTDFPAAWMIPVSEDPYTYAYDMFEDCTLVEADSSPDFNTVYYQKSIKASEIKISTSNLYLIPGQTYTLKAEALPSSTTDKTITWSSDNKAVATVSSSGLVKGLRGGRAMISATTSNGLTTHCMVTVGFLDVSKTAWYFTPVNWAVGRGITNGIGQAGTTFAPEEECTRAQVVTFLYNYFGGK